MKFNVFCLAGVVACAYQFGTYGAEPIRDYPIHPVAIKNVKFTDVFWSPRIEVNRTTTIPVSFQRCEETGRIENFKVAAHLSDGKWTGIAGFNDSDVYKVMEGAARTLMIHPDDGLAAYLNQLVDWVAAAQEKDGYLYTEWTARDRVANPNQIRCCIPRENKKWLSLRDSHELYNLGHMYEAAAANWEATGDPTFLNVAKRSADLLVDTFGPGKLELPSGHPEVELALVKLYRATGDERYLHLAQFFLGVRGRPTKDRPKLWGEYAQDHEPLVDQQEAVGHAVRAMYLYSAATDVAALTDDRALRNEVDRLWQNVVGRKTYITGAIGATAAGEAFGKDYELPNDKAYAETCANLATCFWNHRMFLLHGDGKYIDMLELALYNSAISGVSLDGKTFFYPNPLESKGNYVRSKWFDCACCPTNICRFIPSIPGYAYATRGNVLYVNLFAAGAADVRVDGSNVHIAEETNYPWDGRVTIKITPPSADQRIVLKLRIPGWARDKAFPSDLYHFANESAERYSLSLNGKAIPTGVKKGYVTIDRAWNASDTVTLNLPMPVRRVAANEKVVADRKRVALMRGPVVYCIESPDVVDGNVLDLSLSDTANM
ncbi:MAG TPA: beta-L-arabinofuranosidase domain-containing protein, partial [Lacipirellulaceae bacterium]|nr:beta-L-arabinofuranosidase domain-containing protein [Lacipirellulaceae bacterium]